MLRFPVRWARLSSYDVSVVSFSNGFIKRLFQTQMTFRIAFSILSICFAPAVDVASAQDSSGQSRPNIILFVTDDQNKEDVACYGGNVLTPNVNRLAQEGIRFDNAHVPSTVCTPSRYALLTGRFPGNSYFKPYLKEYPIDRHGAPGFNVGLEDDNMNVGNVLRENGYVTGLVGKLHVGPHLKAPEDFAHYGLYDVSKQNGVMDPDDPAVIAGWQQNEKWFRHWVVDRGFSWAKHNYWGNVHGAYPRHNPEWTLEAALEFIEVNQDVPFYLHYTTTLMHGGGNQWNESMNHPLVSGAGRLKELPAVIAPRNEISQQVDKAGFDPSTTGFTWMDATVGAVLDKLDQLGIADNTLFVFVSDHGTNGKFSLHDHNGTAVPCIMRWPRTIKAGSVSSSLIQTTDFVPTFFDVAGVAKPAEYWMDGISLHPLLSDPAKTLHDHLYFELGLARAVRTRDWKYIAIRYDAQRFAAIENAPLRRLPDLLAYQGGAKNVSKHIADRPHFLEPDQLYHLADDPMESKNLARSPGHSQKLAELKDILARELRSQRRPFGELVLGPDSVPAERIQPYLENLAQLRIVKRGFEVINDATSVRPTESLSRQERKKEREKRKTQRQKRKASGK